MQRSHPVSPPSQRLIAADERGAIMVMGIFMCVFLVGALWFIAGIGDSILFRERMQEASDAVAFSTATIEARGMNLLVLLNLIMAAIEAIRVAINLIIFATLVTAGILYGIGIATEWLGGSGSILIGIAQALWNFEQRVEKPVHDRISPLVDDALEGIHDLESTLPRAIPIAAQASSYEIAHFYAPTINATVGVFTVFGKNGVPTATIALPAVEGTTHKLCMKSEQAVRGVVKEMMAGLDVLAPVMALANTLGVSDLFCELGDKGNAIDTSSIIGGMCAADPNIKKPCDKAKAEQDHVNALETKCASWDPNAQPPQTPPDPECPNLAQLQTDADTDTQTCEDAKKKCTDNAKQHQKNGTPAQGNGNGKEPFKVDHDNWWNGADKAQVIAFEYGNGERTNYSPQFIKIASSGRIQMDEPSLVEGQRTSASQAEFFYDCSGAWDDCDKEEEALWNFHWRARFRLVNPDIFGAQGYALQLLEFPYGVLVGNDAIHSKLNWSSVSPARLQFVWDLKNLLPPMSLTLH